MPEAIAIKLIAVLSGFLYETGIKYSDKIEIDNAPSWYYEEKKPEYIYVFSFKKGGLETVTFLKNELEIKMEEKINEIVKIMIFKGLKNSENPVEIELSKELEKDKNIDKFVRANIKIDNLKHYKKREKGFFTRKRYAVTFGSAILSKKKIIEYEKSRIDDFIKKIEKRNAKNAFKKLDSEISENEFEKEMESEIPKF